MFSLVQNSYTELLAKPLSMQASVIQCLFQPRINCHFILWNMIEYSLILCVAAHAIALWHRDICYSCSDGVHFDIVTDMVRLPMAVTGWTMCCHPTNYELLCWLIEKPSRDFEHYRMTDDSRSRSRDNRDSWKMSAGRLTCEKCQETRGHEFDPRPITKSNVIFCRLFLFTFCFVFFVAQVARGWRA